MENSEAEPKTLDSELPPPGTMPAVDRIGSAFFDSVAKQYVFISKDILTLQLQRDTLTIAKSFDEHVGESMANVSHLLSKVVALMTVKLRAPRDKGDDYVFATIELLANAQNSLCGAVHLLRGGYRLQSGMLLRHVLECVAVMFYLFDKPEHLKTYRSGKFDSNKAIGVAKKFLPVYGAIWGHLSNEIVHIGTFQQSIFKLSHYTADDQSLPASMAMVRISVWILYVATELACHDLINDRLYWQDHEKGLLFHPSELGRDWMTLILKSDVDDGSSSDESGEPVSI